MQCAKEASGVKEAPSQRALNAQIRQLGIEKGRVDEAELPPPPNPWAKASGKGPRPKDDIPIWEREAAVEKERLDAEAAEEAERGNVGLANPC